VRAFDAVAPAFDERYGAWLSVSAQRAAVRRILVETFPEGSRLLELGGGTGEDAAWLARRGRSVHLTDGAPRMVAAAAHKLRTLGVDDRVCAETLLIEDVEAWAEARPPSSFDGAYSNFAALNCIDDLRPVARGLARAVAPGGAAVLVLFGPLPPGEVVVELLRGRPGSALRRLRRGAVRARLGGERFTVRYPRRRQLARAFTPWFRLERARGVGVFVPPSGAEPEISAYPRVIEALATLDRLASAPLSFLGDHVAFVFRRTERRGPAAEPTP
jgi:SAM-dependent methyltransferase